MMKPIVSLDKPHRGSKIHPGGQVSWIRAAMSNDTMALISGRDVGKSVTLLFLIEEESALPWNHHYDVGYVAQSHAKAEERYIEWLERWDAAGLVLDKKNKDQLRYIKLRPWGKNKHGWTVHFWSGDADSAENIRGPRLDRICVDEASFCSERVKIVLWPTANSRKGKKIVVSTPHKKGCGYTWVKDLYDRGRLKPGDKGYEPGYVSFSVPSEAAPWADAEYMLKQRRSFRSILTPDEKTPEEREEFDGEFVSDLGAVFTNLDFVISLPYKETKPGLFVGEDPKAGARYLIGRDWGLLQDNSVSAVFDRDTKSMVALQIDPLKKDYDDQLEDLDDLKRRYNNALLIGDGHQAGAYLGTSALPKMYHDGYVDIRLQYGGKHDKGAYVTRMRRLFQSCEWKMLNVPALRKQFEAFTSKPLGSGANGLAYGAPSGEHDDIVLAVLYASIYLEVTMPSMTPKRKVINPFSGEGVMDALNRMRRGRVRSQYTWQPGRGY